MKAETEILLLPYDSARGSSLLHRLIEELRSGRWTRLRAAVAFAKESGNDQEWLSALLAFASNGSSVSLTFGADVFGGTTRGSDLAAVRQLLEELGHLPAVRVFLYHEKERTFHPKIYLFDDEGAERALVVIGSSNWSHGGLLDNVEADVVVHLDLGDAEHLAGYGRLTEAFREYWGEPATRGRGCFARRVTLDNLDLFAPLLGRPGGPGEGGGAAPVDPAVAAAERLFDGEGVRVPVPFGRARRPSSPGPGPTVAGRKVYLMELSKGRGVSQADLGKVPFTEFFGGREDATVPIVLRHRSSEGTWEAEDRHLFPVHSQNYRVELGDLRGKPYPKGGVPIVAFLRLTDAEFRYVVLMPGRPAHPKAEALLTRHLGAFNPSRFRRLVLDEAVVKRGWPDCPLFLG